MGGKNLPAPSGTLELVVARAAMQGGGVPEDGCSRAKPHQCRVGDLHSAGGSPQCSAGQQGMGTCWDPCLAPRDWQGPPAAPMVLRH